MNNHFHGSQGLLRWKDINGDWVEVTVDINQVSANMTADMAEDTGMQMPGRGKTYLPGNIDRKINYPMFLEADGTKVKTIDALIRAGRGTAAEWYPAGNVTGNFYWKADGTAGQLLFAGLDFSGTNTAAGSVQVSGQFSGDVTLEIVS